MTVLSAIYGASPLNNSDSTLFTFTTDTTEVSTVTALDNTPGDFATMDDTGFTLHVRYALTGTRSDDVYELLAGITDSGGTTMLAGATTTTRKQISGSVDGTTIVQADVDLSGANGYVDTTANKATWDGALVSVGQTHTKTKGNDGLAIVVYQVWITGNYTPGVSPPTITDVETTEAFTDGDTAVTITGTTFEATKGTGKVELSDNATYASGTKVEQTTTSWADTTIDFTADLGGLTAGSLWLWVTNNTGNRNTTGMAVTVSAAPVASYVRPGVMILAATAPSGITFVGSAQTDGASVTSLTLTLPTYQAGDLAIIYTRGDPHDQTISITGATGYTLLSTQATNTGNFTRERIDYKVLTASETDPTLNFSGAASTWSSTVHIFRGVDQTTPIDDWAFNQEENNSASPVNPAVTATTDNGAILLFSGLTLLEVSVFVVPTTPSGLVLGEEIAQSQRSQVCAYLLDVGTSPGTITPTAWSNTPGGPSGENRQFTVLLNKA